MFNVNKHENTTAKDKKKKRLAPKETKLQRNQRSITKIK